MNHSTFRSVFEWKILESRKISEDEIGAFGKGPQTRIGEAIKACCYFYSNTL